MRLRRHRIIPFVSLLVGSALISAACIFGGEGNQDLSEFFEEPPADIATPVTPIDEPLEPVGTGVDPGLLAELLDLSIAPRTALEAVQKFYALIAADRFEDAYRIVSLEAREIIPVEDFATRYRDIWDEATITGLTWEVIPPPGENVAGLDVILRYETEFFGQVEERVFAPTRRQPTWVVDWTPSLIFDGLGTRGFLIHRFIDLPQRGEIFDRNGVPLAVEGEVAVIGISHDLIEDVETVIDIFVQQLELDDLAVRDLVFQDVPSFFFIPIVRLRYNTDPALIATFEQLADAGILIQRETQRTYPQSTTAAHVVGFLSEITEDELEVLATSGYRSGDLVGRDGAEAEFEAVLAGERGGRLTIISPDGQIVREMAVQEMVPARDVFLSLDMRIQRVAELALGEEPGAVVVMDPRSNELLALASFPRFDPNAFIRGLTEEEFTLYFEDELQPFINRTTESLYPPGSTFKIVTMAAALEAGGFDEESRLDCPAIWTGLGEDTPLNNWKEDDRGLLTLTQALAESCNTVFYQIGQRLHQIDEDALTQFAAGFGFGRETGVVGLREEIGVNPGPEWKRINRNDFWYTGDTINTSIGQGFLLVTPLQITAAYAALATDGILRTPLAVHALRSADGASEELFTPIATGVLPVSAATHALLQEAARQVIVSPFGTGRVPFAGTRLSVAGKSGTAEDSGEQSHALFVAYSGAQDPRLIVTVVLDVGESGSDEAGPIVRTVMERSLNSGWVE